jgi:hypothetical protein
MAINQGGYLSDGCISASFLSLKILTISRDSGPSPPFAAPFFFLGALRAKEVAEAYTDELVKSGALERRAKIN